MKSELNRNQTVYGIYLLAGKPLSRSCVIDDYLNVEESSKLKIAIDFQFFVFGRRIDQSCALQMTKVPQRELGEGRFGSVPSP